VKRPRRIVTGPFTWAVSWVKPDRQEVAGETDALNLAIRVMPGNALDFERETLMHELLHACCSVAGLDLGDDGEERVVAGLSPFLLDALRRSPGLADYLLGVDRG
jgi:hypothetical protein